MPQCGSSSLNSVHGTCTSTPRGRSGVRIGSQGRKQMWRLQALPPPTPHMAHPHPHPWPLGARCVLMRKASGPESQAQTW